MLQCRLLIIVKSHVISGLVQPLFPPSHLHHDRRPCGNALANSVWDSLILVTLIKGDGIYNDLDALWNHQMTVVTIHTLESYLIHLLS